MSFGDLMGKFTPGNDETPAVKNLSTVRMQLAGRPPAVVWRHVRDGIARRSYLYCDSCGQKTAACRCGRPQ